MRVGYFPLVFAFAVGSTLQTGAQTLPAQRPGAKPEFAVARPRADRRRRVASRHDTRTDERRTATRRVRWRRRPAPLRR
jgi:hypothetical protein